MHGWGGEEKSLEMSSWRENSQVQRCMAWEELAKPRDAWLERK
jgi:hypothetical protein